MNERNYDFSTLSERISAQTEAAVEFSNALVRIIEQTAAIRDKINDSNDLVKDELKNITQKLQDFITEFNKSVLENKNQNSMIAKDFENFVSKLIEYDRKLQSILEQNDDVNSNLLKSVADLLKYSQKTFDQISDNHKFSIDKYSEHHNTNKSVLDNLLKEINLQNSKFSDFEKKVARVEYMFYAIGAISVILGILSALNVIHVQWLPTK
jgi:gas vesicle protein